MVYCCSVSLCGSRTMSAQLNVVYDYMKRKGKKLILPIKCRMCKVKKPKSEFRGHNHICKKCWNGYVKLSKEDKKKL